MVGSQSVRRLDRHGAQRPLPPGGEDRVGRDVHGLPRLRPHAGAVGGDQADAPGHLRRPGPARALPARGARGRPPLAPPRGDRDRLRRGRRHALHRARVRGGRDAEGPDPPHGPPPGGRGRGVRDRDRPRALRRARGAAGAPRREAPERADRRRGARQGHRLRHRPLAGGPRADRHRARAGHHRLRLPGAGARPGGDRAVRRLLAGDRAVRDAHGRGALRGGDPGGRGDEARQGAAPGRAAAAARGVGQRWPRCSSAPPPRRPTNRYATAADMVSDLEEVLAIEVARSGETTGEATTVLRALKGDTADFAPAAAAQSAPLGAVGAGRAAARRRARWPTSPRAPRRARAAPPRRGRRADAGRPGVQRGRTTTTPRETTASPTTRPRTRSTATRRPSGTPSATTTGSQGVDKAGVGPVRGRRLADPGQGAGDRDHATPGFTAAVYGSNDVPEDIDGWVAPEPRRRGGRAGADQAAPAARATSAATWCGSRSSRRATRRPSRSSPCSDERPGRPGHAEPPHVRAPLDGIAGAGPAAALPRAPSLARPSRGAGGARAAGARRPAGLGHRRRLRGHHRTATSWPRISAEWTPTAPACCWATTACCARAPWSHGPR